MSAKSPIIIIAGIQYELPKLFNLRELRELSAISQRVKPTDPEEIERFHFDGAVDILVVAMGRVAPNLTDAKVVYEMEISMDEILSARVAIIHHSGLVSGKEKKPGED